MTFKIHERTRALGDKLIRYRRDFHRYPESGFTEFRTAAIITKTLEALGYHVKLGCEAMDRSAMMGVPKEPELTRHMERAIRQGADPALVRRMAGGLTGIVGEINNGKGPVVALRFDMDANEMEEAQGGDHRPAREGFASENPGAMHACGHDGHIAMGLITAELLAGLKGELKGTVRLIFQPAEEGVRGAAAMVEAGAVYGVDYILGGHIGFKADRSGQFICGTDKFLATTKFDVTFTGVAAHAGAAPHQGRNALLASATAALNLHAIARHGHGASRVTVGTLAAGEGRNVIPARAVLRAETRGETSDIDRFMFASAKEVVAGAARMQGVDWAMEIAGRTASGQSSPEMANKLKEIARGIAFFHPDDIAGSTDMGGSEDFSHMMTTVQQQGGLGTYFMVGSDITAGHHNARFDFDERCLAPGVEMVVKAAMDLLGGAVYS